MAYRVNHVNKKTGAVYVYSVESYWDKEKKESRNRQVCLGRLNEQTGEIIPSGRKKRVARPAAATTGTDSGVTASAKVFGPYMLINSVASDVGLKETVRKCFGDSANDVLSLAYFIAQKGLPLSRIEGHSESNEHPLGGYISSQRVSELLRDMTEGVRERFFSLWMKKLSETECFCYDITSVSSYAENNAYARYGYNRDGEKLPQINLAMLFGQTGGLPAYFRGLPGFISDVSALRTTMKSLDFLGQKHLTFVLDRGFYGEANTDAPFDMKYRFVLAVPVGRKWVRDIIDMYHDSIKLPGCYRKSEDGEALFMTTHLCDRKGKRCYLHIYFNAVRAAENHDGFTGRLLDMKEELETGNVNERHGDEYEKFFIVKETPARAG
jgi:hypothetical protein